MNDKEMQDTIIEIKTDVKWIKEAIQEHRQTHRSYSIMLWSTIVGVIACWFKR